jgi:hypothetical protein
MADKPTIEQWMELCRGLSASRVGILLLGHDPSCDWRGITSKKEMGEAWLSERLRDRTKLEVKLRAEPRQTKEQKQERAEQKLIDKQVKRLDTYEAVHGIESEEMKTVLRQSLREVLEAYYGAIENERAEAKRRERNARAEAERLAKHALVVDKEIRRRGRTK